LFITEDVDICIEKLKECTWDVLMLDHDLGGNVYVPSGGSEPTGYDVAKWLRLNPEYKPEKIILHSLNPIGRKNMLKELPEALDLPHAWEKVKVE
jgi:hypothetical protein